MFLRQSLLCLLILGIVELGSSLQVHAGLNSNSSLNLHSNPPSSSCPCLGWAETYRTKGVKCGAVFEGEGQEFCETFFEKIEDAICMNQEVGADPMQWCYVSTECMRSKGESSSKGYVNSKVSWKRCTAELDDMTREKTVQELNDWAQHNDIMPALLMKMAYPVYQGKVWEKVKKHFKRGSGSGSFNLADLPALMRPNVEAIMKSGAPVVFDSTDHHPPHGLLEGHKIYETRANTFYLMTHLNPWKHPYQMNSCTLFKGE